MMKSISNVFIGLFLLTNTLWSQQKIAGFKAEHLKEKSLFTVVDDQENVTLFMVDKNKLTGYQLDASFQIKDSLTIPFNPKEFKGMVTSHPNQNEILIYWRTKTQHELFIHRFDFTIKKVSHNTIIIDPGKEKIVSNFTQNNIFHVVTFTKDASIVNIYKTDGTTVDKKVVDCSNFRFVNSENKRVSLWSLYDEHSWRVYYSGFELISPKAQSSLVNSTNMKKAYVRDHEIIFSFDNSKSYTQLLTVDLNDFTAKQKEYPQLSFGMIDSGSGMSNSFIANDYLIQVKSISSSLYFQVKDFEGNVITKYFISSDKDLEFSTSDIYQEEGSFKKRKVVDSPKKLLRKINNLNLSVNSYYHSDTFFLTLGGVSNPQQNSGTLGMFGLVGALIDVAINSSSTISSINSYSNKNVVYVNAKFDKDFKSLPNSEQPLALDKLRLFLEENNKFINPTVFNVGAKLYYIGLNKENKEYGIYIFED